MWSQLGQTSAQKCKAPTVIMKIQNTHRIKIIYKGFLKIDIHIFPSFSSLGPFFLSGLICSRAVNPPHLQILRIDREGIMDDIIMHQTWRHLCKKTCEKDVGIVTFVPDWFTFHRAHYCLNYNDIPGFLRTRSVLKNKSSNNVKYLKFHRQKVKSTRNSKILELSGRFDQTVIWRPGETAQNRESPGLSRRVDSTAVI